MNRKRLQRVLRAGPRAVSDWEERMSVFLQEAIAAPDDEPRICENLIEYVQYLVRQDRATYRQKCLDVILRIFNRERRKCRPRVLASQGEEGAHES